MSKCVWCGKGKKGTKFCSMCRECMDKRCIKARKCLKLC